MLAPISHRGPDGMDVWIEGSVGLGSALLKVVPESKGEVQPYVHTSGAVLVFDGRLDNRAELLSVLRGASDVDGHAPDPALVMACYERYGELFVRRLCGDFAFAIFDPRRRWLLLARDQLGVRPLHYFRSGDAVVFGSEIKAILAHPSVKTRPNDDFLAQYILGGPPQDGDEPATFYENVYSVVPSHVVIFSAERFATKRYWDFDGFAKVRFPTYADYVDGFTHHFERAVHRRLRSDRPVAISVSGGVDSSSIFSVAQRARVAQPDTFPEILGVSFRYQDGSPADESSFVQELERFHGVDIGQTAAPAGTVNGTRMAVRAMEVPLGFDLWERMRVGHDVVAASGARVWMGGWWGDQLLIQTAYLGDLLDRLRWGTALAHLREYPTWFTDAKTPIFGRAFRRELLLNHIPAGLVPFLRKIRRKPVLLQDAAWVTARFRAHATRPATKPGLPRASFASLHARALYGQARSTYMTGCMEWNNKIAAAFGMDAVFPFLDRDLIAYVMALPGEVQARAGVPKAILRDSMRGVMPDAICDRRWKADFGQALLGDLTRDWPEVVRLLSRGAAGEWDAYFTPGELATWLQGVERVLKEGKAEDLETAQRALGMDLGGVTSALGLALWLESSV